MIRKPLVEINGQLQELPAGDDLPPATALNLLDASSAVPEAIAVKQSGVWVQIAWAAFLALIGAVSPPTGPTVTVGGQTVTVNGEAVTVGGAPVMGQAVTVAGGNITVNGEQVTIGGQAPTEYQIQVAGENITVQGDLVKVTT